MIYAHMGTSMDIPLEEDRSREGFLHFHCLMGAFFTFEIDLWESLQDCGHLFVGKNLCLPVLLVNVSHETSVQS